MAYHGRVHEHDANLARSFRGKCSYCPASRCSCSSGASRSKSCPFQGNIVFRSGTGGGILPPMRRSRLSGSFSAVCLAVAVSITACGSSSSGGGGAGAGGSGTGGSLSALMNCNDARACCVGFSGAAQTTCVKAANDAEYGKTPETDCPLVLAKYKPGGMCVTGAAGAGGAGGNVAQPQSAACARFVNCETAVNPTMASDYQTMYGPTGPCWASANAAKDCTAQCQGGLATLHPSFPKDCVVCVADTDCSGTKSKCDTTMGDCVAP